MTKSPFGGHLNAFIDGIDDNRMPPVLSRARPNLLVRRQPEAIAAEAANQWSSVFKKLANFCAQCLDSKRLAHHLHAGS